MTQYFQANSVDQWDGLWANEGHDTWRAEVLDEVYSRIVELVPRGSSVIDVGGGVGVLARRLRDERGCSVIVLDHSAVALELARQSDLLTQSIDLENCCSDDFPDADVIVATEVLEHLSPKAYNKVLALAENYSLAIFSVPNDRLGPDEEPQHARKLTAMEFLRDLRGRGSVARVECLGPQVSSTRAPAFLLGVLGGPARKTRLSVTLPVKDEADDLPQTLASFRGVADEIVVGVDYRTTDRTRVVAAKYADVVFDITDPRGPNPEADQIPEKGVHFGHLRNRCIERCSGDWIFMTEGHEGLAEGQDVLLRLDEVVPEAAKVAYVWRTSQGQRWGYPWLFRNDTRLRFERSTHNQLTIPGGALEVRLPQVRTLHRRSHANAQARTAQRRVQNRRTLLDDWMRHKNSDSLYYLGSELRDVNEDRAVERMLEYLAEPRKNGAARYQTRLQLAIVYAERGDYKSAREQLIRCPEDDWSRVEHWLWLGDLSFEESRFEEALQFYRYASTTIQEPPFSLWWIDEDVYSYLPAQRLTMTYAELGRLKEAFEWAQRVVELLPKDAPQEVRDEAESVVAQVKEALGGN